MQCHQTDVHTTLQGVSFVLIAQFPHKYLNPGEWSIFVNVKGESELRENAEN
jgi:hypothetical protein